MHRIIELQPRPSRRFLQGLDVGHRLGLESMKDRDVLSGWQEVEVGVGADVVVVVQLALLTPLWCKEEGVVTVGCVSQPLCELLKGLQVHFGARSVPPSAALEVSYCEDRLDSLQVVLLALPHNVLPPLKVLEERSVLVNFGGVLCEGQQQQDAVRRGTWAWSAVHAAVSIGVHRRFFVFIGRPLQIAYYAVFFPEAARSPFHPVSRGAVETWQTGRVKGSRSVQEFCASELGGVGVGAMVLEQKLQAYFLRLSC